jgi:hypothetical protein
MPGYTKVLLYLSHENRGLKFTTCTWRPSDFNGNTKGERVPYLPKYKVKVQFTLEQAMKANRGSRGIALLFL